MGARRFLTVSVILLLGLLVVLAGIAGAQEPQSGGDATISASAPLSSGCTPGGP